ncbi:interleukin-1 receptor-associated kinase 4-like [Watersipora subatra]|uniref:interleukin-1 receptor-associated kinase 4-like n=1 Tax=Watersipora subatra TaxID=2589382 RepID=UPI00355C8660
MNSHLPTLQLTKGNPITDIPYHQRRILCTKLDAHDDWKKFVGFITSRDGISPRYNDLHMCIFDKEKERRHGSPTEAILNDWRSLRPTIGEFLNLLIRVELKDSANYIKEDILQEGPIKEAVEDYFPTGSSPRLSFQESFVGCKSFAPKSDSVRSGVPYQEHPLLSEAPSAKTILDPETLESVNAYFSTQPKSIKHYSYAEVEQFTDLFNRVSLDDAGRFLGAGGYGEVYFGTIKTDTGIELVAVKKFHDSSLNYLKQFKTELEVIFMNCRHENLLAIKGVCTEQAFCVIYEYMSHGTVEQRLAEDSDKPVLSADQRLQIAIDVAKGLGRLHHGDATPIVHRDVKPANILLDDQDRAKLGDYGLVRVQTLQDSSHTNVTSKIHGTSFYMPPEAMTGIVSTKWDVYSFGVVLLELLFAKGPYHKDSHGHTEKMIEYLFDDDLDDESQKDPLILLDPKCDWNRDVAQQLLDLSEQCGRKWKKRPNISNDENSVLETLLRIQESAKKVSH